MATAKCTQCKQTVYPLERTVLAEQVFHKGCAKCSHCQGTLSISSFASVNGRLFCKPHYIELFKSSGGKYSMSGNTAPAVEQPSVAAEANVKPSSKLSAFLGNSGGEATTVTLKPTEVAKKENDVSNKTALDVFKQKLSSEAPMAEKKVEKPVVVPRAESTKEEPKVEKAMEKPKLTNSEVSKKASGLSKLSMFLSGENASTNTQVNALVSEVEQTVEAPIVEKPTFVAPSTTTSSSSQQPSGLSKLSMFLQQVEKPAADSSCVVRPASNVVKGDAEVATEKQESVSELIKKTSAKPFTKPAAIVEAKEEVSIVENAKVVEQKPILETPTENESQAKPSASLSNLKEKLSQAKKSVHISTNDELVERLKEELALYKSRCKDLEEENTTLRARVELSDAGKEALVLEIARLNEELQASKERQNKAISNVVGGESNENMVDNSLKHAKKLLSQGKITKSQYEAAAKACAEASRAIHS